MGRMIGHEGKPRLPILVSLCVLSVLLTGPAAYAGEVPEPDPNPSSSSPCYWEDGIPDCGTSVWGSVWISGFVTNPLGQPVVNATIYGGVEPKETNSLGNYRTEVRYRTDNPVVTLRAEKPRFDPQSKTVNPLNASLDGVNFELLYSLDASVSFRYFNNSPQKTLTFDIATGVGPSVGIAQVQLPDGSAIDATYISEGYDGLSHWQAQWQVPSSTPDGHYSYKACAVTTGSSGNCDSVSSGTRLTQKPGGLYTVDGTAPSITPVSPRPNHNTINVRPTIAASLSDATSGVSYGSTKIYLDGAQVALGASSWTPPSGLALGLHHVSVTAFDLAGNSSLLEWDFNITIFSADSATGRITPQTVAVNPQGEVVNAPKSVTFNNVIFTLDSYEARLGPSPYRGYGRLYRSLPISGTRVVFTNESGIPSDPVNPWLTNLTFTGRMALLLGTTLETSVPISTAVAAIGSVTVNVPTGYNTPGSKATIQMSAVPAGPVTLEDGDDPLRDAIPDAPILTVASQTSARIDLAGGDVSVASTERHAEVWADIAGQRTDVLWNYPLPQPPDGADFGANPDVFCDGEAATTTATCLFRENALSYSTTWFTRLRSLGIRTYSHHWIYRSSATASYVTPTYLHWNQLGTGIDFSECQNGRRAEPSLLSATTTSGQTILDPMTQESPWIVDAYAGSDGTNLNDNSQDIVQLSWGSNHWLEQLHEVTSTTTAYSSTAPGYNGLGQHQVSLSLVPSGGQTYIEPSAVLKMALGARYINPNLGEGSPESLAISADNVWKFKIFYEICDQP